jgi:hypothetical protein
MHLAVEFGAMCSSMQTGSIHVANDIAFNLLYCHALGCVNYKKGFGLDDWIYCALYIHTVRDYRQYSAIAILHTFQFTSAHALGFSVFTSRILATDLSPSRCHFNSHMKSSWHSLIPFLPYLLNHLGLTSPELDPIPILTAWDPRYTRISSGRTPPKTPSSIVKERVYAPCLATDVLLLRARMLGECVYRPVAKLWVYMSQYCHVIESL